jgi:cbb3-type cytochrome oxidase maturation protein
MDIIYILLPASLILACVGLFGFIWACRKGQFENTKDLDKKILFDEEEK